MIYLLLLVICIILSAICILMLVILSWFFGEFARILGWEFQFHTIWYEIHETWWVIHVCENMNEILGYYYMMLIDDYSLTTIYLKIKDQVLGKFKGMACDGWEGIRKEVEDIKVKWRWRVYIRWIRELIQQNSHDQEVETPPNTPQ